MSESAKTMLLVEEFLHESLRMEKRRSLVQAHSVSLQGAKPVLYRSHEEKGRDWDLPTFFNKLVLCCTHGLNRMLSRLLHPNCPLASPLVPLIN